MIRILICDDMESVCRYYKMLFSRIEDFEVVGTASNKNDAIKLCRELEPDIMLVDMQMATERSGIEIVQAVKSVYNINTKIIILTVHEDDEKMFEAYSLGVEDYFLKTLPDQTLIETIRDVYDAKHTLRPEIAQKILNECARLESSIKQTKAMQKSLLHTVTVMSMLSNSEFEILRALYDGMSVPAIAEMRFVSESTIRTHIGRILKKFECSSIKLLIKSLREMNVFSIFEDI